MGIIPFFMSILSIPFWLFINLFSSKKPTGAIIENYFRSPTPTQYQE